MRMAANLTAVAIENVRLLERESRARAAAEDSNRLKDEFLATVSHELRTPLTAILGWSRMLESGDLSSQTTERAIETIRRNAKAQAQIVDDILDVSRIITGNLYLDLHPVEVSPVIESAVNVVRPTAEAKSIEIQVHYEPRPLMVSGDSNRLQQVFWNLLSNAIKFTPSGGTVRVDLTQRDSAVVITVSDTGTGIDPEFLPFVFDRFRQADSTTTRRHGGLGLGLAIARHLVEIHGGNISAESCGKDQGSRFTVSLPLIAPVPAIPELGEAPETRILPEAARFLSGLHILVVDDDEDTLELIQAALGKYHARVTAVTSAGEALATLELAEPDVLISDIGMPGTDGYELIKQIRSFGLSTSRTLPAVAITAYAKDEDRDRALASGYQRYLAKPIELEELITAVADALKGEAIAGT
jgi:CheY-like chemotaxis protein/nitrogen-specific signal transduction histidine kinase